MAKPLLLITGATGKVGRHFLRAALNDSKLEDYRFRALCHKRTLPVHDRVETVNGSISDRGLVQQAMRDVTHVVHLATCKESPEDVMDVTVKGLFWLLEEARISDRFQQFLLIGGDACVGHFHYPHKKPVTEAQPHSPYPGCYALSKVLEEVLLEQYYLPYKLNGCCLRAPWIMEKDDFKHQLSFGPDVFGAPVWSTYIDKATARGYADTQTVPVMLDPEGHPVKRNFVHVRDLVSAILCAIDHPRGRQQLFNISMDAQSITKNWQTIFRRRVDFPKCRLRPNTTQPGSIIAKPSTFSDGNPHLPCSRWPTKPSTTSASLMTHG